MSDTLEPTILSREWTPRTERELAFELLAARYPTDARRVALRLGHDPATRAGLSRLVQASLAELHGSRFDAGSAEVERAAARKLTRSVKTRWARARTLARLLTAAATGARSLRGPGVAPAWAPIIERALRNVRRLPASSRPSARQKLARPKPPGRPPHRPWPPRPKPGRSRPRPVPLASSGWSHNANPPTEDARAVVLRVRDLHLTLEHGHWLRRGPHLVLFDGAPGRAQRRVNVRHVNGSRLIGHWLQDGRDALVVEP